MKRNRQKKLPVVFESVWFFIIVLEIKQIAFKVECLSKGLCLKPWAEVVSVTIAQLITLTVAKWQVSRPLPLQVLLWWWGSLLLRCCRYLFYPNHLKLCHLNAPRHLNGHPDVLVCYILDYETGGNNICREREKIVDSKPFFCQINLPRNK